MTHAPYKSLRQRLSEKEKRPLDRARGSLASAPPAPIAINRAHDISAMVVGLMVLKHVEETGRTRLHERAIQAAIESLTHHLHPEHQMRLEVEAYEIVDWLSGPYHQESPNSADVTEHGVVYDPSCSIPEMVREAVAKGFDLKIDYYSSKRAEMNTRVISPRAIAAEAYVRAWCHVRNDERIFRMERIRRAVPVNGKPRRNAYLEQLISEEFAAQQALGFVCETYESGWQHAETAPAACTASEPSSDTPALQPTSTVAEDAAALQPTSTVVEDAVALQPTSTVVKDATAPQPSSPVAEDAAALQPTSTVVEETPEDEEPSPQLSLLDF